MTRKEAVYNALKSRKWTSGTVLTAPDIGGTEGLRRVRELREDGYMIKSRSNEIGPHDYRLVGKA